MISSSDIVDEKPSNSTVWRAYQGVSGQPLDERDLIERYLPLVRNVVDRIKLNLPSHVDVDDLYSVGVTGLIAAVRKYDPDPGQHLRRLCHDADPRRRPR